MSSLLVLLLLTAASWLQGAAVPTRTINLSKGWAIVQDVHDSGERFEIQKRGWNPYGIGPAISGWQPIERLTHLQLLLAPQPYFGRELRYFNEAPWWYKLEFATPADARQATLQFEGVDYYAKVWLNEQLLGEHEGYSEPFSYEVGPLLSKDKPNLLIVKVSSPWDTEVEKGRERTRFVAVVRRMFKGTYEHADTFVQRDVNPVGIWRPVKLITHDGLRSAEKPVIDTKVLDNGAKATVSVSWPVALNEGERAVDFSVRLSRASDGVEVAKSSKKLTLKAGQTPLQAELTVNAPALWNTWDRGGPVLYRAQIEVRDSAGTPLVRNIVFGIRSIELKRTPEETTFYLNGKRLYLRGTTYWPDVYISNSGKARYERDLDTIIRAGLNAVRIHVHEENPEFYAIADRKGVAVFQDFDLNWTFPTDEAFTARAVTLFRSQVQRLRSHPSILCWIPMNEANGGEKGPRTTLRPGPQLYAEARRIDPNRPAIKNSQARNDPDSGDGHDYRGSLSRGKYTDIFEAKEKLNTEYGADAPPSADSLLQAPKVARRLKEVMPRVAELHDYQYRLIKYYTEHYRIQKYAPNSGYFQFMWIDFCPQSFYGVYDYWGRPKSEGIGGGLRALEESSKPIGIFMEYKDKPVALHAVNDTLVDHGEVTAKWLVTAGGEAVTKGEAKVRLGPDSHARVAALTFPVDDKLKYRIVLELLGAGGKELSRNVYLDPFHHPERAPGYPERMDHEIGVRLWWAGMQQ